MCLVVQARLRCLMLILTIQVDQASCLMKTIFCNPSVVVSRLRTLLMDLIVSSLLRMEVYLLNLSLRDSSKRQLSQCPTLHLTMAQIFRRKQWTVILKEETQLLRPYPVTSMKRKRPFSSDTCSTLTSISNTFRLPLMKSRIKLLMHCGHSIQLTSHKPWSMSIMPSAKRLKNLQIRQSSLKTLLISRTDKFTTLLTNLLTLSSHLLGEI